MAYRPGREDVCAVHALPALPMQMNEKVTARTGKKQNAIGFSQEVNEPARHAKFGQGIYTKRNKHNDRNEILLWANNVA